MLTWSALTRNAPIEAAASEDEIAITQQRREALQIRSLLEHPALREAMGLGSLATFAPAAGSSGTSVKHRTGGKRNPKVASVARSTWGTSNRDARSKPHPRFDRRALLESDSAS